MVIEMDQEISKYAVQLLEGLDGIQKVVYLNMEE